MVVAVNNQLKAGHICLFGPVLQMAAARSFSPEPDADVPQSVRQNSCQSQSGVGVKTRLQSRPLIVKLLPSSHKNQHPHFFLIFFF